MNIRFCALIVILACSTLAHSQEPAGKPPIIDSQLRQRLVNNITRELQERYVAPEKTEYIAAQLRTKLQSGAYEKINSANDLASALTNDLRTASNDLHLLVTYNPALERALKSAPPLPSSELPELPPTPEQLTRNRQSNYDFRKLEIMSGNVGYLELRSFVDLNQSKDTAAAAMNFLANTDAVIIDLRRNPGGFINLEIFLASYFYGVDPVELLSRYHREGNVTIREWTLRDVPGKRLQYVDLYIHFLGASGVRRKLHALASQTFLIEDQSVPPENQARIRFIQNGNGKVTELQLMVSDGRTFPRARQNQ